MTINTETVKRAYDRAAAIAAAIKKHREGKPLSDEELKLISGENENQGQNRIFPNLKAAATGLKDLKITLAILRKSRDANCPAIRANGTIHEPEFREWWATHAGEVLKGGRHDKTYWQTLKAKEDYIKARDFNKTQSGKYIESAAIAADLSTCAAEQKGILRQKLENELPSDLVGLDVITIRAKMRDVVDQVCIAMAPLLSKWA